MTITPRTAVLQLVAAAAAVVAIALVDSGAYPLPVDLLAYAAAAAFAAWAVAWAVDRSEQGRVRREADWRTVKLQHVADIVISARPRDDYPGETLRPADVCQAAAFRHGLLVDEQEAADMLARRMAFRGYPVPRHLQHAADPGRK